MIKIAQVVKISQIRDRNCDQNHNQDHEIKISISTNLNGPYEQ